MLKLVVWIVLLYLIWRSGRNLVRAMLEDLQPPALPSERQQRRRPWEEIEDARWVDLD
ncbi:hypothetical protein [Rhodothermus bifroesti]|uniref:hypothetical protein n=1 Tax=Rhodothermus bifroesti TaxID=2823335 RepID=UPI000CC4B3E7|nr:hypothetical protein [Rhodothermus bifroesti]GBD02247.1 hypothetical protein HRbin18_01984 [bacterium HR18]